jgi:hypothetical protein
MKVYRVEKDGRGPLVGSHGCSGKDVDLSTARVVFKKGDNISQFVYGCTSMLNLMQYFGDSLYDLQMKGYRITNYNVKLKHYRVAPDGVQCAMKVSYESKYIPWEFERSIYAV